MSLPVRPVQEIGVICSNNRDPVLHAGLLHSPAYLDIRAVCIDQFTKEVASVRSFRYHFYHPVVI